MHPEPISTLFPTGPHSRWHWAALPARFPHLRGPIWLELTFPERDSPGYMFSSLSPGDPWPSPTAVRTPFDWSATPTPQEAEPTTKEAITIQLSHLYGEPGSLMWLQNLGEAPLPPLPWRFAWSPQDPQTLLAPWAAWKRVEA